MPGSRISRSARLAGSDPKAAGDLRGPVMAGLASREAPAGDLTGMYGDLLTDEAAETVTRMAGFDDPTPKAATGTADPSPECSNRARNARTNERGPAHAGASDSGDDAGDDVIATIGESGSKRGPARPDASPSANSPARIRTWDQAIMSRLLDRLKAWLTSAPGGLEGERAAHTAARGIEDMVLLLVALLRERRAEIREHG